MLLKKTLTAAASFGTELTRHHILTVWFGGSYAKPIERNWLECY